MFFCCIGLHTKWVDGSLRLLHGITLLHIFNLVVEIGYLFIILWSTVVLEYDCTFSETFTRRSRFASGFYVFISYI